MRALLARACLVLGLTLAAVAHATPTLSIQSFVCNGCTHTVTWSEVPAPSSTDWIGLYTPGAANTSYIKWQYTTGTASGSIPYDFPSSVAFGNYELRLFAGGTFNVIATSSFSVAPTVSGTVTDGGSGLAGVSIALNGVTCTTSPAAGAYGCFVPYGWSGTITPSLGGYLFTPASRSLSNVTNHINSNNFATATTHAVSGTITREGLALSGAAMAGSNGASCTATNASGQYTCAVLPGWSGTVTPSLPDTVFTPASRSYTNVTAAQSAQSYIAQAFYQVSGTVTLNGLPLPNVAFAATGGPMCTSSNGAGQYSCAVPLNWSGSVTPSASGYSFGPASRSYTSVSSHQSAQTFAATLETATAPLYFVHVDHLNTPRLVANQQGQAVWRWDQQEPFGNNVPDENPSGLGVFEQPFRFPGQYADKETNLFYNYFRDYDPGIGRYGQSDPVGVDGGLNTYSYVDSEPLFWIDSPGLGKEKPNNPPAVKNPTLVGTIPAATGIPIRQLPIVPGAFFRAPPPPTAGGCDPCRNVPQIYQSAPNRPTNLGFLGQPQNTTLPAGTKIIRYGKPTSEFAAPVGTPPWALSIPPTSSPLQLNTYQLTQAIPNVQCGIAAPWYFQFGGGTQYVLPSTVQQLLQSGVLVPVP